MRTRLRLALLVALLSIAGIGCGRLTGLPEVPASVDAASAGLDSLDRWSKEARRLSTGLGETERVRYAVSAPEDPFELARWAKDRIVLGFEPDGLELLARALELQPTDLVIGNEFRMQVYNLKRRFLAEAKAKGERTPELPELLRGEPLATLERIAAARPGREIRLQIALAHVDQMALYPALEIKAPASIDSVHAFTAILDENPYYVPALVGRGLNHLYRPVKLVWPEHPAPPKDAASQDLALAAAVGMKVGGVAPRLKGTILVALGDACAHEGKLGIARSWWSLARKSTEAPAIDDAVALRTDWSERDVIDRLEDHLDERMADVDHPVGDLSFLWSDDAKGPS